MHILNKMKLSKLGILYYGEKSNDSIVHYDDAAYSKLHVPIVYIYIYYTYNIYIIYIYIFIYI